MSACTRLSVVLLCLGVGIAPMTACHHGIPSGQEAQNGIRENDEMPDDGQTLQTEKPASPGNAGASDDLEQKNDTHMNPGNTMLTADLTNAKWRFYFQEVTNAQIKAQFDEANQIVAQSGHPKGSLEDSSEHLGNWFILRYSGQPSESPQPEDESRENRPVFVVDMNGKRVMGGDDWQAVHPLYRRILQEIQANPARSERNVRRLASLTSIIAFGHERYADPKIETDPNDPKTATLQYDVNPTDSSIIVKHCRVQIKEASLSFLMTESPGE